MSSSTDGSDPALAAGAPGRRRSRPFLFDLSFDEPQVLRTEVEAGPDAASHTSDEDLEPPAPTYSEEELAAARAEGFAAGREDALQQAQAGFDRIAAEAGQEIAAQLYALMQSEAQRTGASVTAAVRVAAAIARKVIPALAADGAEREVTRVIEACVPLLLDEPRLVIRTHPDLVDVIRGRIEEIGGRLGFEGRFLVTDDPGLGAGDARVEWSDGGAVRDEAALWAEIDDIIARNLQADDGPLPDHDRVAPGAGSPQPGAAGPDRPGSWNDG